MRKDKVAELIKAARQAENVADAAKKNRNKTTEDAFMAEARKYTAVVDSATPEEIAMAKRIIN